jgi:hypothetical protein
VDQLAVSLNIGIESLYNALNKNVSLKDNMLCTVKDLTITVDATGKPTTSTQFALDISGQIIGTQVIYAINTTNSASYPTGGIFISFTQTTTGVLINNITGLPANQAFTVRVVAYGQ